MDQIINLSDDNDTSDSDSDGDCEEIQEIAQGAGPTTHGAISIPEYSKRLYERQYRRFQDWRLQMGITNETDEEILLTYFEKLSENYKPTTLFTTFTKLKSMIFIQENIDISRYSRLLYFLKEAGKSHIAKRAKIFTREQISKFVNNDPDDTFLLHKVSSNDIFILVHISL